MTASGTDFVGRVAELAALDAALADARAGRPRAVVVRGEAGIGKSSLVRALAAHNGDCDVLAVTADESETLLAYGTLAQLWLRGWPGVHAPDSDANPTQEGAQLLRQFGRADAEAPLICIVDDIQWSDEPSLLALTFALRRLVAERLLVVLVHRDEPDAELPANLGRAVRDGLVGEVVLGPLSTSDVSLLSNTDGTRPISPQLAIRLHEQTGGNPLYILAILAELGADTPDPGPGDPLPAPRVYAATVLRKLDGCGPAAGRLIRAAAVLGMRCAVADAAALTGTDDTADPIDRLLAAGLIDPVSPSGRLQFSHPLVQAAVYHDIPPAERRALHLAAATAAATAGGAAQSLHHRIAAAGGRDDALAGELVAFAAAQAATLHWTVATDAFTTAAELTGDTGLADAATRGAVECLMFAGRAAEARALLPRVLAAPDSPAKARLLGFAALLTGESRDAERLLTSAWDTATAAGDRGTAGRAASDLALLSLTAGGPQAIDWAHRALQTGLGPVARGTTRAILATARAQRGQFAEGLAEMGELPSDVRDFDADTAGALLGRGVLHLYHGDVEAAVADLTLTDLAIRSGVGLFSNRVNALLHLGDAEYRLGSWDQALTHAELATSLGDSSGAIHTLGLAHAVAVFPAAGRGDWDGAEAHLRAAESFAQANGDTASRFYVSVAEMRLELARDNPAGAAEAGAAIARMDGVIGVDEPGIQPWKALYARALIGSGRPDEAAPLIADLLAHAQARGNHRALVRAHHARARQLAARGRGADAHAAYADALANLDPAERGLDAALLRFDYGQLLGADGRLREARRELGHAASSLRRLGASPYLERCQAAVAAVGGEPSQVADDLRALLTAQELATATLVATGLSNREVAAELVISHKTVEYHLGNVFRKLQVSSRTMLSARMSSLGT